MRGGSWTRGGPRDKVRGRGWFVCFVTHLVVVRRDPTADDLC